MPNYKCPDCGRIFTAFGRKVNGIKKKNIRKMKCPYCHHTDNSDNFTFLSYYVGVR